MKKQFLPLVTAVILGGASAANAQITITPADFKMAIGTDSAHVFVDFDTVGVVLPTTGANQLWDYSALAVVDSSAYSDEESDKTTPFDLTTGMYESIISIGNFTVDNIKTYYNESDSGVFYTGYNVQQKTITLSGTNTLEIPAQDVLTEGSYVILPFDLTSTTNESYTASESLNYILNYTPFYTNTPGVFKRDYEIQKEVIGWGSVILPKYNDTVEGLLLKTTFKTIDSLFLNNAPADPLLLSGLNITQGDENVSVSYDIIAKDFNCPAMSFTTDETGAILWSVESANSSYYIDNTPPVDTNSIAKINGTKINAYPNPTSSVLTFDIDNKAKLFAEVYNIEGRVVARQPIVENQLNVAGLKTGTYFVVIRSENSVLGTTKFIKE